MINGASIPNGAKYFVKDGSQNYLVFQPDFKYFQTLLILIVMKSKRLSEEIFKTRVTSVNSFASKLTFLHKARIEAKFKGKCLIQDNISFTNRSIVNSFIVNELDTCSRDLNHTRWLFGAVKLTNNADADINMDVLVMVLGLIYMHNYHCQMVNGVKCCYFWSW